MNELKRIFFVLAVAVSLGLVGTSDAFAQASCTANSVPTLVRTEGVAELTGSIVLGTCVGTIPAGTSLTATIQPALAVVTNLVTPPATGAVPTITITTGAGVTTITGATSVSGNTVSFPVTTGAALVIGTTAAPGTITLGVVPALATTGIRVNVNASGIVFPGQISALLTSSPAGALAITNNFLNVAIPQPGLTVAVSAGSAIAQCASRALSGTADVPTVGTATFPAGAFTLGSVTGATIAVTGVTSLNTRTASNVSGVTSSGGTSAPRITLTEGFPSAFSSGPLGVVNNEGADATQGTRFIIRITGMPTNVVLFAPDRLTNTAPATNPLQLRLVTGAVDVTGFGGTMVTTTAATAIATTYVVYEVFDANGSTNEVITVTLAFFTTGTPSAGAVTAGANFAPLSAIGTATQSAPAPRFADNPTSGRIFTVVPCVTNILFPFVTNQAGFETGFAIANTTSDIFGTPSQSGTCVYNFFGQNAPTGGTFTTAAFAGGVTDVRLLSAVAPGFQGYVIAQCNFQLGHGFFFIQNGFGTGTATIAQGSPALIITQPTATGSGGGTRVAAASTALTEALGH